jgi:hypothetical protein
MVLQRPIQYGTRMPTIQHEPGGHSPTTVPESRRNGCHAHSLFRFSITPWVGMLLRSALVPPGPTAHQHAPMGPRLTSLQWQSPAQQAKSQPPQQTQLSAASATSSCQTCSGIRARAPPGKLVRWHLTGLPALQRRMLPCRANAVSAMHSIWAAAPKGAPSVALMPK